MAENTKAVREEMRRHPVLRTCAVAPIIEISRWKELDEGSGIGICRITVMGEVLGPASRPPRITFYIRDGGVPGVPGTVRPDEARRCAAGLHVGDLVRIVGIVGAERPTAGWQEVIGTEEVKCKDRAPLPVAEDAEDEVDHEEPESIDCRVQDSPVCFHGRFVDMVYGDEGMAEDRTFDGDSVICDACYTEMERRAKRGSEADQLALAGYSA